MHIQELQFVDEQSFLSAIVYFVKAGVGFKADAANFSIRFTGSY